MDEQRRLDILLDIAPAAHRGTCHWYNHPMHQVRLWTVYLLDKVL